MSLTGVHGYVLGFLLIGSWAVISGWAFALRFTSYEETPTFWRVVSVAQILLALQWVVGIVLLLMGRRPGAVETGGDLAFHLAYGLLFPAIVLGVAHSTARSGRYKPHSVFALAGLIIFGLSARAWMVGTTGA